MIAGVRTGTYIDLLEKPEISPGVVHEAAELDVLYEHAVLIAEYVSRRHVLQIHEVEVVIVGRDRAQHAVQRPSSPEGWPPAPVAPVRTPARTVPSTRWASAARAKEPRRRARAPSSDLNMVRPSSALTPSDRPWSRRNVTASRARLLELSSWLPTPSAFTSDHATVARLSAFPIPKAPVLRLRARLRSSAAALRRTTVAGSCLPVHPRAFGRPRSSPLEPPRRRSGRARCDVGRAPGRRRSGARR